MILIVNSFLSINAVLNETLEPVTRSEATLFERISLTKKKRKRKQTL